MKKLSDLVCGVKEEEVSLPKYNTFLEKKGIEGREKRGFLHFHPSAFGDCVRKMALQYHGEKNPKLKIEEPIDVKFMRICDAGHAFHDRMQRDMAAMGILRGCWRCRSCGKTLGEESKIGILLPEKCGCLKKEDKRRGIDLFEYQEIFLKSDPEFNFKGNTDGVIDLIPNDENSRSVIDFKSIKSERFAWLKKPELKYVIQVMIYMWLTGVKKAVIYYEDKNLHHVKEFYIPYNETLVEQIKKNAKSLKIMLEKGKIPKIPQDYEEKKVPCRWCDYKKICYRKR